jgi:hypothetical protein
MKLALLALASVVLLAPGCTSTESETSKAEQRVRELEGHALLDDYVGIMKMIASSSSKPSFDPLAEHEARASELERAGKIDPTFRTRHRRLVAVTRAMLEPSTDPKVRDEQQETLQTFMRDVAGGDAAAVDLNGGLAQVSAALVEEVLSLHMLLGGDTDREAARVRYGLVADRAH